MSNKTIEKIVFSKADLLKTEKFQHKKDIVWALLEDDKSYSIEEVEEKIENYLKGEVR